MSGSPPPGDSQLVVRPARPAEHSALLALTAEILAGERLALRVLTNRADVAIGFLGLAGDAIEALFLEPVHRRQGGGRRLVAHALALRGRELTVDVNEQTSMRVASTRHSASKWPGLRS